MLKFALEMLWTERKKAYGLIVSIVTTLSICLLFLHFIINPYLAKKVTYDDILDFSEPYCIVDGIVYFNGLCFIDLLFM